MMELEDFLRKLRHIEFRTRIKTQEALVGTYHSTFKGRGMTFSECKPYVEGDDVRYIDWNASARQHGIFVKQFVEERELSVCVILDLSPTMRFGSIGGRKSDTAIEAMAILAMSALHNNDKVGLFLFNETGMKYVPQVKGKQNIPRLILEALRFNPDKGEHTLSSILAKTAMLMKRRSLVFVISDFIGKDYEQPLQLLKHHHEVIPIVVSDPMEANMPDLGFSMIEDVSTQRRYLVDTADPIFRAYYREQFRHRMSIQNNIFNRNRLTTVCISTTEDILVPIARAFNRHISHVS
ncbi:MAG: DUF58 domain-containing protein [Bradymonadia bacterium]